MATDRARRSYDPTRGYRSVVAQQGRVTLEADTNEAEEIRADESRSELVDIIGPTGTPNDGFKITVPGTQPFDFDIADGTIYLGGVRTNIAGRQTYLNQREWRDRPRTGQPLRDPDVPTAPIREVVYLEVAEQEITAVEDPALREVALGGPDTAGRTRMVQRVRRGEKLGKSCEESLVMLLARRRPGLILDEETMRLASDARLRVTLGDEPPEGSECDPTAKPGFLGAENQCFRVKVTRDNKLLWGDDNASFLYSVKITGKTLELKQLPVDAFHRPRAGQWVEVLGAAVDNGDDSFVAMADGWPVEIASYDPDRNTITLTDPLDPAIANLEVNQRFVRIWQNRVDFGKKVELVDSLDQGTGVFVTTSGTATVGDYWVIGVRPMTPDKVYPERLLMPQPPDGPARWATPLAMLEWSDSTNAFVHDCRRPFVPLTEQPDLAFHNRHLHGWGVVCGMQVHCMTLDYAAKYGIANGREWVTVNDGYAIHPTGADIRLRSGSSEQLTPINVVELALKETKLKLRNGEDGSVSLWIDRDRTFHVDPYTPKTDPKDKLEELLRGTMLWDIYTDCILNIITYVRALIPESSDPNVTFAQRLMAVLSGQQVPLAAEGLVGPAARRLIALLNLVWQVVNQTSGRHIYLSGDLNSINSNRTEDGLLRSFFEELKNLLQSKTFCAMFDDVDYPRYDVYRNNATAAAYPTTIFGTARHTRLRVHPNKPLAYTCGAGSKVNAYSLKAREIVESIDFPDTMLLPDPTALVQDVALSRSALIFAIAWTGPSHTESTLAQGRLRNNGTIEWTSVHSLGALKFVTLLADPDSALLYGAARGAGVYELRANTGAMRQLDEFRASGHMVIGKYEGRKVLFAGEDTTNSNSVRFNVIRAIDAKEGGTNHSYVLPSTPGQQDGFGQDDIAFADGDLQAIVDDEVAGERCLRIWPNADDGPPPKKVSLGKSSGNRIAYSERGQWNMITYFDGYDATALRKNKLEEEPGRHPLQIIPCAIATDEGGRNFYVLEYLSNTITMIPATAGATPWVSAIDTAKLEKYRVEALTAFVKLGKRFVQYLKDCICEHLLINCPDQNGRVYLADISIKNGAVYQICNFHSRKYVHSFPTVEYWLSLLPIIPYIKQKVEWFCCSVDLTSIFAKQVPPKDHKDANADKIAKPAMLMYATSHVRDLEMKNSYFKSIGQLGKLKEVLTIKFSKPAPGNPVDPKKGSEVGGSLENVGDVMKTAATNKIRVGRVIEANLVDSAINALRTAPRVAEGDTVDLIVDHGVVIGATKATSAAAAPAADELAKMRVELAAMRAELDALKTVPTPPRASPARSRGGSRPRARPR